MSVSLFNKDIARKWKVQAMEPALDSERLKKFLEHPELFTPLRKAINYYQAANKLKGDEYLACWIRLDVQWDSAPQTDSSRRGKFLAYVPWLKLAVGK